MSISAEDLATFVATGDTLVLATVTSPCERALLDDWLREQRKANPGNEIDVIAIALGPPAREVVRGVAERLAQHPHRDH